MLKFPSQSQIFATFFVLGFLIMPAIAEAQSAREISNRLQRLENEIETLSRAIYRGEQPPPSQRGATQAANTEIRLQQLEGEIRNLTGALEQQSFEIRQLKAQLDRLNGDLELRLGDLERGNNNAQRNAPAYTAQSNMDARNAEPAAGGDSNFPTGSLGTIRRPNPNVSPANANASAGTISRDAAAQEYEEAFSLLKNSDYSSAEREFSNFLSNHPRHVLAGNAKYWLGETHYVRGDFETAARVFAEGYQQYPDGSKAADNLLKLGMSLAATGNSNDACIALKQLETQYSTGAGPVLRRAQQEMSRLGC